MTRAFRHRAVRYRLGRHRVGRFAIAIGTILAITGTLSGCGRYGKPVRAVPATDAIAQPLEGAADSADETEEADSIGDIDSIDSIDDAVFEEGADVSSDQSR